MSGEYSAATITVCEGMLTIVLGADGSAKRQSHHSIP